MLEWHIILRFYPYHVKAPASSGRRRVITNLVLALLPRILAAILGLGDNPAWSVIPYK